MCSSAIATQPESSFPDDSHYVAAAFHANFIQCGLLLQRGMALPITTETDLLEKLVCINANR